MVDGRSVYSPFTLGDTHYGLTGVILEDIERIEVLRGSNSAAYGANAMFGVINIITRHSLDTRGGEVSVSSGEGGIFDNRVRIGWGDDGASYRISVGRQQDNGYRNAYDDRGVNQFHFRGDLRPDLGNDILLEAGTNEANGGEGTLGDDAHTVTWYDTYLHGQWRHQVSAADEFKLSASFNEEHRRDRYMNSSLPLGGAIIDQSGRGRRFNLEAQYQLSLSERLRGVAGVGYLYQDVRSRPLYNRDDTVSSNETRVFGTLEWRFHPQWLLNGSVFIGRNRWTGSYAAPRLMANFSPVPDQTFRFGVAKSERTPNLVELAGDMRVMLGGVIPVQFIAASGKVRPETLLTQELGYLGSFREWNLTLDVRAYHERIKNVVATDGVPADFVNNQSVMAKGMEYQLRWHPLEETEFWLNQNFQRYEYRDRILRTDRQPPSHATTLALFQKLPANLDLTLTYALAGKMNWRGRRDEFKPERLDVRLGYSFLLGSHRAELAVALQSAYGDQPVFLPSSNFLFQRRAFATLRLEY